jgi:hypothetical protein
MNDTFKPIDPLRNTIPELPYDFLLESHPSRFIEEAPRTQPMYNAIYDAVIRYDPACIRPSKSGFARRRGDLALTTIKKHNGCIIALSKASASFSDYGLTTFVAPFFGYLLYWAPRPTDQPVEIISVGVNHDCRRQLAATRMLYCLTRMLPTRSYRMFVHEESISLLCLLRKHSLRGKRLLPSQQLYDCDERLFVFSWQGLFPLLKGPSLSD